MLRTFVSYPYQENNDQFVRSLKGFLEKQNLEVIDGKWPDATKDLGADIAEKIKNCTILIAILTNQQSTTWVDQEIGIAIGASLEIIIIADGDVKRSGALSNRFFISRSDGDLVMCTALAHTLNCIKKKIGTGSGLPISSNTPVDEYSTEDWPNEIQTKIDALRQTFSEAVFEKALKQAVEFSQEHKECWRFEIAKTSALIHLRRFNEAQEIIDNILHKFSQTPRAISYAHNNKGWLLNQMRSKPDTDSIEEEISEYREALKSEERSNVYLNLVQCLLEVNRVKEAETEFTNWLTKFPDALKKLRTQVELQGAEFIRAISKSSILAALLFPKKGGEKK